MALKNVRRVTFSLPKTTIVKLEMSIPKNKRSKFLATLIDSGLNEKEKRTFEEYCKFWDRLADSRSRKSGKTSVELVREDRASH